MTQENNPFSVRPAASDITQHLNDLQIYHSQGAPRRELISGRRPYSDDPEDYVTYIEDDHFTVGPRQRDAYAHWHPDHPDHERFRTDLNTRWARIAISDVHNAQRYAKPAEKVDWKNEGF